MRSFTGVHDSPIPERMLHLGDRHAFLPGGSPGRRGGFGRARLATFFGLIDVRAAAFDLNGTLTDDAGRVAAPARSSLRRLRRLGVKTILMTGCTREELAGRGALVREFDAVVLESGTILLDRAPKPLATPTSAILALRARCEQSQIPYRVGLASLTIPSQFGRTFYAWPESSQVTTHVSRDRIDVTPPGHDKGTGLRRVLARLGLTPADCVAFGDAQSDLPMFSAARYSVAVGNAEPIVKELAREVAPGVAGHAVARFLDERLREAP